MSAQTDPNATMPIDASWTRNVSVGPYSVVNTLDGGMATEIPLMSVPEPGGMQMGISLQHHSLSYPYGNTSYAWSQSPTGQAAAGWVLNMYCYITTDSFGVVEYHGKNPVNHWGPAQGSIGNYTYNRSPGCRADLSAIMSGPVLAGWQVLDQETKCTWYYQQVQTAQNWYYLSRIVDPHGVTLTFGYDGSNRLTSISDPFGRSWQIAHNLPIGSAVAGSSILGTSRAFATKSAGQALSSTGSSGTSGSMGVGGSVSPRLAAAIASSTALTYTPPSSGYYNGESIYQITLVTPSGMRWWNLDTNNVQDELTTLYWPSPNNSTRPTVTIGYVDIYGYNHANICDLHDKNGNHWHYDYAAFLAFSLNSALSGFHHPLSTNPSQYYTTASTINYTSQGVMPNRGDQSGHHKREPCDHHPHLRLEWRENCPRMDRKPNP